MSNWLLELLSKETFLVFHLHCSAKSSFNSKETVKNSLLSSFWP